MPAKSKSQRKLMGMVHAMQKGEMAPMGIPGKMANEMNPQDVTDFASTKEKGLPIKVKQVGRDIKKIRPRGAKY